MESTAETTKDASVDDFLARIRELGDRQDKEDEERTRKLEEEILAAKQARQARRAGMYTIILPSLLTKWDAVVFDFWDSF